MKNDFIKNKNNVVKSKSKVNFFAFLVIIVVSLCSVLGCVFGALNYFGVNPGKIHTAKADTWTPSDYNNLLVGFPDLNTTNCQTSYRENGTIIGKVLRSNGTYTEFNLYNALSSNVETNSIPFKFLAGSNYTFFYSINFQLDSYYNYLSQVRFSFNDTSIVINSDTITSSNVGGISSFYSINNVSSSDTRPSNFRIRFIYKSGANQSVFIPFRFYLTVGLWLGDFSDADFQSSIFYQVGVMQGYQEGVRDGFTDGYDNGFSHGEQEGYNSGYSDGVSTGYDNGYELGVIAGSNLAESFGLFSSCTFRYNAFDGNNEPAWINNHFDYSDWLVVPSNYISPYYGGFYLNSNFDYGIFYNILQDYPQKSFIVADFGDNGISLDGYTLFQVIRYMSSTDSFVATGEFGSACAFRFLDGTYLLFNNADEYFSSIDLNSYVISSKLRSIEFIAVSDYSFFTLMSNVNFTNAYFTGYSDGNRVGYDNGYNLGNSDGYNTGYNTGYNVALSNSNNYSFLSLMGAVVDAPIRAFTGLLNFNLLGFNMLGFFVGLLTLGVILWVVKLLIAGKK